MSDGNEYTKSNYLDLILILNKLFCILSNFIYF